MAEAGKERYVLLQNGVPVLEAQLCAAGEYPMPVVALEFYFFGSICWVTILLNNTELHMWSSVAAV